MYITAVGGVEAGAVEAAAEDVVGKKRRREEGGRVWEREEEWGVRSGTSLE